MKPTITAVRLTGASRRAELPLLVLGPASGTSATATWSACAAGLADAFDLLAWDLPGHGHNRSVPDEPYTVAELAAGVLAVVEDVLAQRGEVRGSFAYAGGGDVARELLGLPRRVTRAVLLGPTGLGGGADAYADRRLVVLPDLTDASPAEDPRRVVTELRRHLLGEEPAPDTDGDGPVLDPRSLALVTLAARAVRDPDGVDAHARQARLDGLAAAEVEEALRVAVAAGGGREEPVTGETRTVRVPGSASE
ncbi:carboxymuconolactone decarboxylase family protein [Nocardioides dongkuii]|uniref:carboxymuconolactone decarboxylase family protein n=1 Tax=Nocardioides dongkuii TaxID=2760089 RepID=UPI0015FC21D5|nr:carboxymuconolactone decarboxylase family protein [Nocardioides dongkuii]